MAAIAFECLTVSVAIALIVCWQHSSGVQPSWSAICLMLHCDFLIHRLPVAQCVAMGIADCAATLVCRLDGGSTPSRGCNFLIQVTIPAEYVKKMDFEYIDEMLYTCRGGIFVLLKMARHSYSSMTFLSGKILPNIKVKP